MGQTAHFAWIAFSQQSTTYSIAPVICRNRSTFSGTWIVD
jgi:hypothetical protein